MLGFQPKGPDFTGPPAPRVLARLIWGSGPLQVLCKRLNVLFRRILSDLTLVSIVYHTDADDGGSAVGECFISSRDSGAALEPRLGECSQRETGNEGNLKTKRASDASPNTLWLWLAHARSRRSTKATADCTVHQRLHSAAHGCQAHSRKTSNCANLSEAATMQSCSKVMYSWLRFNFFPPSTSRISVPLINHFLARRLIRTWRFNQVWAVCLSSGTCVTRRPGDLIKNCASLRL